MSAAFWAQKAQALKKPTNGGDPEVGFPPLSKPVESAPNQPDRRQQRLGKTLTSSGKGRSEHKLENSEAKKTHAIEEKENRIRELEGQILRKDEYIQQLVRDIDEKDFKIKGLEAKLEIQSYRMQHLEVRNTEASHRTEPEYVSGVAEEVKFSEDVTGDSWADIVERESTSNRSSESGVTDKPKAGNTIPQFPTICLTSSDSTSSTFPDRSTPSAVVKPAPKLSFPITNGGKIGSKSSNIIKSSVFPWPTSQPSKDIREMSQSEREGLYHGPTITVIIGDTQIRGVPKHMFMVASPKVRKYFEQNPKETYIPFPRDGIAIPVMNTIKRWLEYMGTGRAVFSLKLNKSPVVDLSVRAGCIYLGMDKYVAHFTKQYCDRIRDEGMSFLTFETIGNIENNTDDNDSLFLCLVNNLASLHRRGKIPELQRFDEFLAQPQHSRISQAIRTIEARLAGPIVRKRSSVPASKSEMPRTLEGNIKNGGF